MKPTISRTRALIAGTALATVFAMPIGIAVAASDLIGSSAGLNPEAVTASLSAQGYEVSKVKPDDGGLEAYAIKDGKIYEIQVDATSGTITKIEEQD